MVSKSLAPMVGIELLGSNSAESVPLPLRKMVTVTFVPFGILNVNGKFPIFPEVFA